MTSTPSGSKTAQPLQDGFVYNEIVNLSPSKFTFATPRGQKRKDGGDENMPPPDFLNTFSSQPFKRFREDDGMGSPCPPTYRNPRGTPLFSKSKATPSNKPRSKRKAAADLTVDEKLEKVNNSIKECDWSWGEYIFHMSNHTSRGGRTNSHAQIMSTFLQGRSTHTPIQIIDLWLKSPDGRLSVSGEHAHLMYSFDLPYISIKPIRPALTAFAVQTCKTKLVYEARKAVEPDSGLHATLRKTARHAHTIELKDLGSTTFSEVGDILQNLQPTAFHLLGAIAGGVTEAKRKRRPVETVVINTLSSLDFTRNSEARLLPLLKGFMYFAHGAPVDLIAFNSRTGDMPSYTTIRGVAKQLGAECTAVTLAKGRNVDVVAAVQIDNVQNYAKVRDPRIGRVNHMNIGIAGTFYELEGADPKALDLEDKRAQIAKNERASVTVNSLLSKIDNSHLSNVFILHWLRILCQYIPELRQYQPLVSEAFRSCVKSIRLPANATQVHPLSTSGKNETVTTELKDGLVDFLSQVGQADGDYLQRLVLVGGDGLTFQKLHELRKYLQFHEDPLQSLEIVEPVLSLWHTEWTNLCRIFHRFWDSLLSHDPSTLGHTAAQIGRSLPPGPKTDYYQGTELLHLTVDMRILDCWRNFFKCSGGDIFAHFKVLGLENKLPSFDDLKASASKLHHSFSSSTAIYRALGDTTVPSAWSEVVPEGTPWPTEERLPPPPKGKLNDNEMHQNGDRVLANSINLIRDGLYSIELTYAIAEGDVGRVYEILKVLLFMFAGSSHPKYTNYLLEFTCSIELESSEELRNTVLRSTLVNLSGRPGGFTAADLMQEYFNRLLEAIVEKKGVEYGEEFIRNVISPNLHHFARIKLDMKLGVGLAKRSGRHSEPHLNPEIKTLLNTYHTHELHKRRPGRAFTDTARDDFNEGVLKLQDGRLKRWIQETTGNRGLLRKAKAAGNTTHVGANSVSAEETTSDESDQEGDGEVEEEDLDFGEPHISSQHELSFGEIADGELVLSTVNIDDFEVDLDVGDVEEEDVFENPFTLDA